MNIIATLTKTKLIIIIINEGMIEYIHLAYFIPANHAKSMKLANYRLVPVAQNAMNACILYACECICVHCTLYCIQAILQLLVFRFSIYKVSALWLMHTLSHSYIVDEHISMKNHHQQKSSSICVCVYVVLVGAGRGGGVLSTSEVRINSGTSN